jgi:hypothetical protein
LTCGFTRSICVRCASITNLGGQILASDSPGQFRGRHETDLSMVHETPPSGKAVETDRSENSSAYALAIVARKTQEGVAASPPALIRASCSCSLWAEDVNDFNACNPPGRPPGLLRSVLTVVTRSAAGRYPQFWVFGFRFSVSFGYVEFSPLAATPDVPKVFIVSGLSGVYRPRQVKSSVLGCRGLS